MNGRYIDISLCTEELKALINAAAKIFPMSYAEIEANLNPDNYEYVRCTDIGVHKNEIYRWSINTNTWGLIGADDRDISWLDLKGRPAEFPPEQHQHIESEISDLQEYALKTELAVKEDKFPNRLLLLKLAETIVNESYDLSLIPDHEQRLVAIEGGYSDGHLHGNLSVLDLLIYTGLLSAIDLKQIEQNQGDIDTHAKNSNIHVTSDDKDNWNGKADKTYVDTQLSYKADKTTVEGHTGNATIHVTSTDKTNWNGKTKIAYGVTQPTDGSEFWYKIL